MPESVDRPAPERTSASPSTSRSASAETPSTVRGAAVTGPWSLPGGGCARASAGRDRALQPFQQGLVDPAEPLGRERALEEATDAACPGPGGPGAHAARPVVGRVDGPGGHHSRVRVALHQGAVAALGDEGVLLARPLGGGLQPPVHPGAAALPARVDPVLA